MSNLHADPLSPASLNHAASVPCSATGLVSPMETQGYLTFPTYSGSVPVYSSTTKN